MHKVIILWDQRLKGSCPQGKDILKVEETTSIHSAIRWTKEKAEKFRKDDKSSYIRVKILAHGGGVKYRRTGSAGSEGERQNPISQGGGYVQFAEEDIHLDTIKYFGRLKGLINRIDVLGCGVAYITPGSEGTYGDGNVLCSRWAQIAQAEVRASTAWQFYNPENTDFDRWEGTVLTYGPKGNVLLVENSPLDNYDYD